MNKNIKKISAVSVLGFLIALSACNNNSGQPAQQAVQTAPQQAAPPAQATPAQAVTQPTQVETAAQPPATPLIPVNEEPAAAAEPTTTKKTARAKSSNIDKPLPGTATDGNELIGNYSCAVISKKLSIGPFKAPPFGCKIYRAQNGALKIASSSEGAGSMKGNITDNTQAGFFIQGKYELSGNTLVIKARMKLAGVGKYSGNGRGRFNDDKSNQINYKLTLTRK